MNLNSFFFLIAIAWMYVAGWGLDQGWPYAPVFGCIGLAAANFYLAIERRQEP